MKFQTPEHDSLAGLLWEHKFMLGGCAGAVFGIIILASSGQIDIESMKQTQNLIGSGITLTGIGSFIAGVLTNH